MSPSRPSRRPPEPYASRISAVRARLAAAELDGLLILQRPDQYWLTGFTGEDGGVLLTRRSVTLLTDGRFGESAARQAPFARKVLRKTRSASETAKAIRQARLTRVGYDPDQMNVRLFTELRKALNGMTLVAASDLLGPIRRVKDADEVKTIRRAVDVAQQAFKKTVRWIKPGRTERQVAARLTYEMQSLGAEGPAFDPIVASGPHGSLPHHSPTDRPVRLGEPLLIDWGARLSWYASDLTRMVWVGSIPRQISRIFEIVAAAQQAGIAAVRPGAKAGSIDAAARRVINQAGYGDNFIHSVGHALGLAVHETPTLRRNSPDTLEPGMVLTVEPGIYLPDVGGVRLEDDVLVTANGYEVLSNLPLALRL